MMTTLQLIAKYETDLDIGFEKLRALELKGDWNQAMYLYWLDKLETYQQLCKPPHLF